MINKGFTLIETLVAILILMVSIVGPLTIASRGLSTALIAKDKTTAIYLAQDAIEFIRYQRDTNRLQNTSWLYGLDPCISADGSQTCTILSISHAISSCPSAVCTALNFDSASYTYLYSGGQPSIYTRSVSIKTPTCSSGGICNANEAMVTATVTWKDIGSVTHSINVIEHLLNWQ